MRKNRLIALIGTLTMAAAGLAAVSAGVSSKKADSVDAVAQTNSSIRIVADDKGGWDTRYVTIWSTSGNTTFESGYNFNMLNEDLQALGYTLWSDRDSSSGYVYNLKSCDKVWSDSGNCYEMIVPWYVTKLDFTVRNNTKSCSYNAYLPRGNSDIYQWKGNDGWYHASLSTSYTFSWSQATVTMSATGGSATFTPYNSSATTSATLYRFTRCTLTYDEGSTHKFTGWAQNGADFGTSTQNQQWTVGSSASYALEAKFDEITYQVHNYADDTVASMSLNGYGYYTASVSVDRNDYFKVEKKVGSTVTDSYGYSKLGDEVGSAKYNGQVYFDQSTGDDKCILSLITTAYSVEFHPGWGNPVKITASDFSISYYDEGGGAYSGSNLAMLPSSHTYNANGSDTALVDGAKSDYTFLGWFTDSACSGSAITSLGKTEYTANISLYAKWIAAQTQFTVTLDSNGGVAGTTTQVTATLNQAMPAITGQGALPTKLNNTFNGYWDATSGGTKYYNADGTSAKNWDVADDTTLYAQWIVNNGTYITGSFSESGNFARDGKYVMTVNPDKASGKEFVHKNITLAANATLKVYYATDGDIKWQGEKGEGDPTANSAQSDYGCHIDSDKNLVVEKAGTYDVYFDTETQVYHIKNVAFLDDGYSIVVHNESTGDKYYHASYHSGITGDEYKVSIQVYEGETVRAYHQTSSTSGTVYDVTMNESVKVWTYTAGVGLECPENGYYSFYLIKNSKTQGFDLVSIFEEGEEEAIAFAKVFLAAMKQNCGIDSEGHISTNPTTLANAWHALYKGEGETFTGLSKEAKDLLKNTVGDEQSESEIKQFAASYDYIYGKYGEYFIIRDGQTITDDGNFAQRNITPGSNSRNLISINNISSSTWIIATVAVVGVAAIGVFFIDKKRKEN